MRTWSLVGGVVVATALVGCGAGSGSESGSGRDSVPETTQVAPAATADTIPPDESVAAVCVPSADPAPEFPIGVSDAASDTGPFDAGVGWRFVEENRTTIAGEAEVRQAAELSGQAGEEPQGAVVQALYAGTDQRSAWNEFLWQDPQWSSRDAAEPTWSTVTEPGAFEPPYRFAYFTQLGFTTEIAASIEDRVYEGVVDLSGVSLQRYCVEEPDLGDTRQGGLLRFLVHPDGYVTEWVYGQRSDTEVRCVEIVLDIAPDVTVPGLREDLPPEWFTELRHLTGCRAAYETDRVELEGVTPPPSTTLPVATDIGAWHEVVDNWCLALQQSAPADIDRDEIANTFELWVDTAPSAVERDALTAAAKILRSDETDPDAMEPIGRRLEAAGLSVCGSLFIGG